MAQKHLINTQVLQLEVATSKDAYAIQHSLSKWVQEELNPLIESLFNRLISEDMILRLDQVVLDIGNITVENNNLIAVRDRILKLLEETLTKKIDQAHATIENRNALFKGEKKDFLDTSHPSLHKKHVYTDRNSRIDKSNDQSIKNEEATIKDTHQSLRQHYFDIWLYWLEKGNFPPYTVIPKKDWMISVLETLGLDLEAVLLLTEKVRKKPGILERLVLQHTTKELQAIAELYTGFSQKELSLFIREIKEIVDDFNAENPEITPLNRRFFEIWIWKEVMTVTIQKREKKNSNALAKAIVHDIIFSQLLSKETMHLFISKIEVSGKEDVRYPFLQTVLGDMEITKRVKEDQLKEEVYHPIADQKDASSKGDMEQPQVLQKGEELASPQYFNNAGMILLHPFLNNLFKKLELLEGHDFKDVACRSKAVLLLHFLATGEEKTKEYEMVLPKFLCNLPPNVPMDHTITITESEKKEANALLEAVIEHWGALGSTSPDGLREGFLTRQGKLEKEQTGWKLYIEQKTLDILLDRLPWNLSLIKLPWMKELLKVEWR